MADFIEDPGYRVKDPDYLKPRNEPPPDFKNLEETNETKREKLSRFLDVVCARDLSRKQVLLDGFLYLVIVTAEVLLYYRSGEEREMLIVLAGASGLITFTILTIPNLFWMIFVTGPESLGWSRLKGRYTVPYVSIVNYALSMPFTIMIAGMILQLIALPLLIFIPLILPFSPVIIAASLIILVAEIREATELDWDMPSGGTPYPGGKVLYWKESDREWNDRWKQPILIPWRIFFRLWRRWIILAVMHLPFLLAGLYVFYFHDSHFVFFPPIQTEEVRRLKEREERFRIILKDAIIPDNLNDESTSMPSDPNTAPTHIEPR